MLGPDVVVLERDRLTQGQLKGLATGAREPRPSGTTLQPAEVPADAAHHLIEVDAEVGECLGVVLVESLAIPSLAAVQLVAEVGRRSPEALEDLDRQAFLRRTSRPPVLLVHRLAAYPLNVRDFLPGPALVPRAADLRRLELLDQPAQCPNRAETGTGIAVSGRRGELIDLSHVCQPTLTHAWMVNQC